MKKLIRYLSPFQWAEIIAVTGFTIYFAVIDKSTPLIYNIISAAAAICGIFCVVICAAGKKSQYYWGFANIIAYIIVSWQNKFFGEVMLNALYYFPSQFVGLYLWKKNYNESCEQVNGKKMKPAALILMLSATGLGIVLYKELLAWLGGSSAWLDSTSTVISITANALMITRYREQWILWIIVDAVTVIPESAKLNPRSTIQNSVNMVK